MNQEWLDRAMAQHVTVLNAQPAIGRYNVTGQVLLKDRFGGIAPLGSFEMADIGESVSVFPTQSVNTTGKNATLAASMGICSLWEGQGLLTLRFVHQSDGPDFALTDVEEGQTREALCLLTYRGFDADHLLSDAEPDFSVAKLGAIPGLMRILACTAADSAEGYTVKETLEGLPEGSYDPGELRPWFIARLRGDDHAG